jgi:drug/metabolite transporter (DMT)-like permease
MNERTGVLIAIVSCAFGGSAVAVTRFLVGDADPALIAWLRFGLGFLFLLPITLAMRIALPPRSDWPAGAALGVCFLGVFLGS